MPARNLPLLTNAHNTNSRIVQNNDNRGHKDSTVVHFYENEHIAGSGYAYSRRPQRESSRCTSGSVVSQNPVHLPAVQTNSAASNRGRNDDAGGTGDGGPVQAISPDTALEQFSRQMSSYEQREICNYSQVYFIGLSAVKRSGVAGSSNNDGYDDDHGAYIQVYYAVEIDVGWLKIFFKDRWYTAVSYTHLTLPTIYSV